MIDRRSRNCPGSIGAAKGRIELVRNRRNLVCCIDQHRHPACGQPRCVLLNSNRKCRRVGSRPGHAYATQWRSRHSQQRDDLRLSAHQADPPAFGLRDRTRCGMPSGNGGRSVECPPPSAPACHPPRGWRVGLFDADAFGGGHGGKRLLPARRARGWRHLLACDTCVHHTGRWQFWHWRIGGEAGLGRAGNGIRTTPPDRPARSERRRTVPHRRDHAAFFRCSGLPTILMLTHAWAAACQHVNSWRATGKANCLLPNAARSAFRAGAAGPSRQLPANGWAILHWCWSRGPRARIFIT